MPSARMRFSPSDDWTPDFPHPANASARNGTTVNARRSTGGRANMAGAAGVTSPRRVRARLRLSESEQGVKAGEFPPPRAEAGREKSLSYGFVSAFGNPTASTSAADRNS